MQKKSLTLMVCALAVALFCGPVQARSDGSPADPGPKRSEAGERDETSRKGAPQKKEYSNDFKRDHKNERGDGKRGYGPDESPQDPRGSQPGLEGGRGRNDEDRRAGDGARGDRKDQLDGDRDGGGDRKERRAGDPDKVRRGDDRGDRPAGDGGRPPDRQDRKGDHSKQEGQSRQDDGQNRKPERR